MAEDKLSFSLYAGENTHLLLSTLVKHLDHKNVIKQSNMQIDMIRVIAHLAQRSKRQASIALVGSISDLMKLLRKCMQCSLEASDNGDVSDTYKLNATLHLVLEDCLVHLLKKVLTLLLTYF